MATQLIVAGFHRSGTSLTARLLGQAGVFLGDHLRRANRTNPHGFFEDEEVMTVHEAILADNGLSWQVDGTRMPTVQDGHISQMRNIIDKRNAAHTLWGFKDPRVCLFLKSWKRLLPGAKVLLVYRHPADVMSSLHSRHADELLAHTGNPTLSRRFWEERDFALRMWLAHNKALLDFAVTYPEDVMSVSFGMLQSGFPIVKVLNKHWDLGLDEIPTTDFFDSNLGSSGSSQPVADESLLEQVSDIWVTLEQLTSKASKAEELVGTDRERAPGIDRSSLYLPTNAYDLQMHNQFLNSEVSFLRDRLGEKERTIEEREARLDKTRKRLEEAENRALLTSKRKQDLESAEKDLQLIISRMSRSRLAKLFRVKEEFRKLECKYFR